MTFMMVIDTYPLGHLKHYWDRSALEGGGGVGWGGDTGHSGPQPLPGYCSVVQLCPTLWNPMDCSMPDSSVLHHLPEFPQINVH